MPPRSLSVAAPRGDALQRTGEAGSAHDLDEGAIGVVSHWLMKSEPDEASIDHFLAAPGHTLPWTGVRGWQARNFMKNEMHPGDRVLFYHSSCPQPGIVGIATVTGPAVPDTTQFDPASPYHDPKSKPERPRWVQVDVRVDRKTRLLSLAEMRDAPELATMVVLRRGNRLSIMPVTPAEWDAVLSRLGA